MIGAVGESSLNGYAFAGLQAGGADDDWLVGQGAVWNDLESLRRKRAEARPAEPECKAQDGACRGLAHAAKDNIGRFEPQRR